MYGFEMLTFNVKNGFLGEQTRAIRSVLAKARRCQTCNPLPLLSAEAVVRGHKSGLLTVADYNNLTQCEALDDIKLNLVSRAKPAWRTLWAGCTWGGWRHAAPHISLAS